MLRSGGSPDADLLYIRRKLLASCTHRVLQVAPVLEGQKRAGLQLCRALWHRAGLWKCGCSLQPGQGRVSPHWAWSWGGESCLSYCLGRDSFHPSFGFCIEQRFRREIFCVWGIGGVDLEGHSESALGTAPRFSEMPGFPRP